MVPRGLRSVKKGTCVASFEEHRLLEKKRCVTVEELRDRGGS